MKALFSVLSVMISVALLPSCETAPPCPCPDVVLDTISVKFEKNVYVSFVFPTVTVTNAGIIAAGWTNSSKPEIVRSYFTIPSLDSIDSKFKIKSAHFVWYGDLAYYDDRLDVDTSFIYVTSAPAHTISNINWNTQPTILPDTKIPVVPPYSRVGKVKIEVTDVINRIKNGTLPNNVFLFRLKDETPYGHKSYKGVSTLTQDEAPVLEVVQEKPFE